MFLKCSQHIRVRTIYRGRSGNRKLFFNVPYTLGSAQFTTVVQKIGIFLCSLHIRVDAINVTIVVQEIGNYLLMFPTH